VIEKPQEEAMAHWGAVVPICNNNNNNNNNNNIYFGINKYELTELSPTTNQKL
jgi:hypothetical protein